MDGPEYLPVRYTKRQIERHEKTSDQKNECGRIPEEIDKKGSEIKYSALCVSGEYIFQRYHGNPKKEEPDETDHVPGELVDNDQESDYRDDGGENEAVIQPEDSRTDRPDNGTHSGGAIAHENKHSEEQENPADYGIPELVAPNGTCGFFLFLGHGGERCMGK